MNSRSVACLLAVAALIALVSLTASAQQQPTVGVVSHVKVLTDKWPDVSSLEAWKKSYIPDGMKDADKAMAVFNTEVTYQAADAPPPQEFLQAEGDLQDPIKLFNVYGYSYCSVSSANVAALARYVGLKARNSTIQNHVVPEMYYDGAWHMMDADLIEYFPKADGTIASLPEIVEGVQTWEKEHKDFPTELKGKKERYVAMKKIGWKAGGPEILSRNPFYDDRGWLPCTNFAWGDTMSQFSKITNNYECSYSMGYEVNVQLREGERLTRNWSNKGLFINSKNSDKAPGSVAARIDDAAWKYLRKWGDVAPGRVGNGLAEYDVPLASGEFRKGALAVTNLAAKAEDQQSPAVHVKDPAQNGILDIRMPSSYVYLTGTVECNAAVGAGGQIRVLFSDNNGLDWKDVATIDKASAQKIDLGNLISLHYCYILRFDMKGAGTGLDSLKITHDVQHSQRPLPALKQGENKVNFTAGAPEGTLIIEGAVGGKGKGKNLFYTDFHPKLDGIAEDAPLKGDRKAVSATFTVKTPGDMTRLHISDYFTSMSTDTMGLIDVSYDDGKTWKNVDKPTAADMGDGKRHFVGRYVVVNDVPAGTRAALVRYSTAGKDTIVFGSARIGADYKEPAGGFRPVQVTYVWEEGGAEKKDVHVAKSPDESWTIKCDAAPVMKSLILELAK